jgi:UrcA family protein
MRRDDDSSARMSQRRRRRSGVNDGDHTMKRSILCAAALALVGTLPAHAGDVNPQRQVVVSYGDINVKQVTGARILLSRIDMAADDVCGPAPDMRELSAWKSFRDCRKTAMGNAVASLPFDLAAMMERPESETLASR